MKTIVATVILLAGLHGAVGFAQGRVTVSAGVVAQPTTTSFVDDTSFPFNRETAQLVGTYDVSDGLGPDFGIAIRFWRRLTAGVSVTYLTRPTTGTLTASYPHPFFFNTPRSAEMVLPDLNRTELGIHPSVGFAVPSTGRVRVMLFAGPSIFQTKQDVMNAVNTNEAYPYDTISISQGATAALSESVLGFHAGADATWYFSHSVGIGGLFRFARGTKSVTIGDGKPFDLEVGGLQASAGVRFRF